MWASLIGVLGAGAVVVAAGQGQRKPIENPTAADLEHGARLFASSCSRCHGLDGSGGTGPPLTRPTLRRAPDDVALLGVIAGGVPGTAMPASWILSEVEVARIGAYVRSLGSMRTGTKPPSVNAGSARRSAADVRDA